MIIQKNQEVNDNMEMIQLLAVFQILLEFEKWRAIRSGGGWCGWRACVGGMPAWVTWVACLHGWRASVGGIDEVLIWVACYYYCYRYY